MLDSILVWYLYEVIVQVFKEMDMLKMPEVCKYSNIITDECDSRLMLLIPSFHEFLVRLLWKLKVLLMQISLAQIRVIQQITISLTDLDNSAMVVFSYKKTLTCNFPQWIECRWTFSGTRPVSQFLLWSPLFITIYKTLLFDFLCHSVA